jgi:hypothetical protein
MASDLSKLDEAVPLESGPTSSWNPPTPSVMGQPLPEGYYDFRITEMDFELSSEKHLVLVPLLEVVGGEQDGKYLRFQRFSTKWFYEPPKGVKMDGQARAQQVPNTSGAYNLLRAAGFKGELTDIPTDPRAAFNQANMFVGLIISSVKVDWEAYCKDCGKTTVRGMKRFPGDGQGGHVTSTKCPKCGADIEAQARIPFGGLAKALEAVA